MNSKPFSLNTNDFAKGLLVAVIVAVLGGLQQMLTAHGLDFQSYDWPLIINLTVTAFVGYLSKNFLQSEDGSVSTPIAYPAPGRIALTEAGRQQAQFPETVGTTDDLHKIVLERLDGPKRRVLAPLLSVYPDDMPAEELCAAAGYAHPNSKGFTNPRGQLKSFGLIEYPTPGRIKATDVLFL